MSATPYVGNDVFMKVHEMAICKICGAIDNELPANWIEWQCGLCENDEMQGSVGVHSREERAIRRYLIFYNA